MPTSDRAGMVRAMGLLEFLKRKSPIEKHGERVANKRTANADRWESIQALGKIVTTEPEGGKPDLREAAVAALMERFTFYVDPTITDGEEKDETYRWVCEAGAIAIPPVRAVLRAHDSASWGLKCLEQLLSAEEFIKEMLELLETMDTEYLRDPQRKEQLLSTLEEKRHPSIGKAVVPFFLDVNESARFHAHGAVLAQDNAETFLPAVNDALREEESVRVKVRVLEQFGERGWSLAEGIDVPEGWWVDKRGIPRKTSKQKK